MAMSGFICHDDYLQKTAKLTDEEVGRLFRSLMRYHATGVAEDFDGRESIAFDFIREDIDRTEAAYKAKCEKNRNTRLAAIANERQQTSTNVNVRPQKEKEKEKEKEKDQEQREKERKRTHETEITERFGKFWDAYPRKEAKQKAEQAFRKVDPDDALLTRMLDAIAKWKNSEQWTKDGKSFIPHPATWLNGRRWEDEVPKPAQGNRNPAAQFEQRDYSNEGGSLSELLTALGV